MLNGSNEEQAFGSLVIITTSQALGWSLNWLRLLRVVLHGMPVLIAFTGVGT